ncbi:hypothetical protein [Glutamicibacter ardleyensis]|uniref:hypothetical protein n=1 Tax=Glutamicibacter ardleyensis TaxID=225894 RepID=UPI003FD1CFDE
MPLTSRVREALRDKAGSIMIDSAISATTLGLVTVSTVTLFAVFLGHANTNIENLDQDRANRNAVSHVVALKGDEVNSTPDIRIYEGHEVKVWSNEANGQNVIYASNPECGAPDLTGCRYASQHLISGQGATADEKKRDISITDSTDNEYELVIPANSQSIRYLLSDVPVNSTMVVHPGADTTKGLALMRQEILLPGPDQDRDDDRSIKYVSGVIELPEKLKNEHSISVEVLNSGKDRVATKPFFYTLDRDN